MAPQSLYGINPDLTVLGKVIGGGMPVGAFGGKAEIMDHIAPEGPVYQAGTLSGNPIAMTAGLTTLKLISVPDFFEQLTVKTRLLIDGIVNEAKAASIPLSSNQSGAMFGLFFSEEENISGFKQVTNCNLQQFNQFFHGMLEQGVYLAPSSYEAGFVSNAHSQADIDKTIDIAAEIFKRLNH